MLPNILIYIFVVTLVYAYINHNSEFAATASAIRQIWSGSCRLSCRQSEYSGFSGLSGVAQGLYRGSVDTEQEGRGHGVFNNGPGPSGCVCDTCPCALLENALRISSPVTNLYSAMIDLLSSYYYEFIILLTDLYKYVDRVLTCGVSCQRTSQLEALKLDSGQNISFPKSSANGNREAVRASRDTLNLKPSALVFRKKSDGDVAKAELRSSTAGHNIAQSIAEEALKAVDKSGESAAYAKNCSKCSARGKVCLGNCPRVKEKKH